MQHFGMPPVFLCIPYPGHARRQTETQKGKTENGVENMYHKESKEIAIHHTMALAGGFFGMYALMTRSSTFGSSETSNLIFLVVTGLSGSLHSFLIRLGALLFYIAGIVFATLAPKLLKKGTLPFISIGIDVLACLLLARIPESMDPVLALYPMFFATAVQWLAFTGAAGYNSATIFSTDNLRQCFASLSEYLYERKPEQKRKCIFYSGTLLCFHLGVVYCWFCLRFWGVQSIYACLILLAVPLVLMVLSEERHPAVFRLFTLSQLSANQKNA